jgi:hypothetical protein
MKPTSQDDCFYSGVIVKVESISDDNPLPPRSLLKVSFEKETLLPSDESQGCIEIAYMDMEEGQLLGKLVKTISGDRSSIFLIYQSSEFGTSRKLGPHCTEFGTMIPHRFSRGLLLQNCNVCCFFQGISVV